MAIRWLNNYHRGFNRLWLLLSIIGVFATVGVYALAGGYTAKYPEPGGIYWGNFHHWLQRERNHEHVALARKAIINRVVDLVYAAGDDGLDKKKILEDVRSMREAKVFTTYSLKKRIDEGISKVQEMQKNEKIYQKRKWKAGGRFVRDLLGSFIVTFAFGHGVFLVVYWIIKGFRKG